MKKPKYFCTYIDNRSIIERMSNEQIGELFRALFRYADLDEELNTGDLLVETVFDMIAKQINREFDNYNEKCEKLRKNALKRYENSDDSAIACNCREEKEKEEKKDKKEEKDKKEDKKEEKEKKEEEENNSACADSLSSLSDNSLDSLISDNYSLDELAYELSLDDKVMFSDKPHTNRTVNNAEQDCDYIIKEFNTRCKSLPMVTELTHSRRNAVAKACPLLGQTSFEEFFDMIEGSDFLSGRSGKWTGCNFDWVLKPENIKKILSGVYNDRAPKKPHRNTSYDIEELMKIDTLDFID